jgi:hypothetical protein
VSSVAHVIGIDPGLVHTGCVSMMFNETKRTVTVEIDVVTGPNVHTVNEWIQFVSHPGVRPHIFVERYVPRQRLNTDERMVKAEGEFVTHLKGAKWIRNTGSKQVIKPELMQLLGVWQFPVSTHHQDLRAAARIALFGMTKDPALNAWLADLVRDTLEGKPWRVQ